MPGVTPIMLVLLAVASGANASGSVEHVPGTMGSDGRVEGPLPVQHLRTGWGGYLGNLEARVSRTLGRASHRILITSPDLGPLGGPAPLGPPQGSPNGEPTPGSGLDGGIPTKLWFGPLVPNPSRGELSLRFDLPRAAAVRFSVIDVAGRVVHHFSGRHEAGRHSYHLDARGIGVRPGIYFLRMDVDGQPFDVRRLVLIF